MATCTEILDAALIPPSWQDSCYITDDGLIFTPEFDPEGKQIKTGEENYNAWLAGKPVKTPPADGTSGETDTTTA